MKQSWGWFDSWLWILPHQSVRISLWFKTGVDVSKIFKVSNIVLSTSAFKRLSYGEQQGLGHEQLGPWKILDQGFYGGGTNPVNIFSMGISWWKAVREPYDKLSENSPKSPKAMNHDRHISTDGHQHENFFFFFFFTYDNPLSICDLEGLPPFFRHSRRRLFPTAEARKGTWSAEAIGSGSGATEAALQGGRGCWTWVARPNCNFNMENEHKHEFVWQLGSY